MKKNISILDLYNFYCSIKEYDGLGYWYNLKKNLYINCFDINKIKIKSKKILYLYKQFINEDIKIIKLEK